MSNLYLPRLLKTIKGGNQQKKQKISNRGHLVMEVEWWGRGDDEGIR